MATTELELQGLVEDGVPSEKIVVRYNGVDSQLATDAALCRGQFRLRWNIPIEEQIVLFLSRLIPRKGADILIDAFARVYPTSGRLVIAGPEGQPGYRADLEKHAKEAGVADRVLFTGPLYDTDKTLAFADADLFVLPSRYENFANAAAEAMACGVPVIVSDACGIASLVQDHAGLVIAPRVDALIEALRTMAGDKELYARFKTGSMLAANQLGWDNLAEQMESYYTHALVRYRA